MADLDPRRVLPAKFADLPDDELPPQLRARVARQADRDAKVAERQVLARAGVMSGATSETGRVAVELMTSLADALDTLEAAVDPDKWAHAKSADRNETVRLAVVQVTNLIRLQVGRVDAAGPTE